MTQAPEYCKCGKKGTITNTSGDRRVARCNDCWKRGTRRLLADLTKRKSRSKPPQSNRDEDLDRKKGHRSHGPNIQRGWQIMNLTLPYCIAIANRGAIWRSAVRKIILEIPGIEIVGETGSHQELFHLLGSKKLDLIILDIPDFFDEIQKIKTFYPSIKILVLSINHGLQSTHDALSAGVDGYLLKSDTDTELIAAIKNLRLNEHYISSSLYNHFMGIVNKKIIYKEGQFSVLSVREKQIIALIAEGGSSKEIAEQLSISHRTVHCHRANILRKLGLKRTTHLIKLWLIEDHRIQN